ADAIPLHAGPRVVAVRRDLHGRARAVIVEPAEPLDELLLAPVSPQVERVGLRRMDPRLGRIARADALRPRVAEQPVRQEAEAERTAVGAHGHARAPRAEARALEHEGVGAGREVRVDRPAGARPRLERAAAIVEELAGDVR